MSTTEAKQATQPAIATPATPVQRTTALPQGGSARGAVRGLPFEAQEAALTPVQRKAEYYGAAGAAAGDVHAAAERGTQGSGGRLPHADAIQRSFGGHDISSVQAYSGGAAKEANQAMGARAFASGDKIAFGDAPDLHTAAHEAAHVVQQKRGVSLSGGVGQVGDSYEQHADRVADAVVQGKSAEALLGPVSNGGGGGTAVQHEKKGFRRGRELTEYKSGSAGAKEDYVALMHGSDEWRAEKIHGLLTERKSSANQLFYHLQMLVMGSNAGLPAAYAAISGGNDLITDIQARTSHNQGYYLSECVRTGSADFECQLLLALGCVTDTGCNIEEVEALVFHEEIPESEKEWALQTHRSVIKGLIGSKRFEAMEARIESAKHKDLVDAKVNPSRKERKADRRETQRLADEEAAAIVRIFSRTSHHGPAIEYHKVSKKGLAKQLLAWAKRTDEDTRRYVRQPGTQFMTEMDKTTVVKNEAFDKVLKPRELQYVLDCIDNAIAVDDAFYGDDKITSQMSGKGRSDREEDAVEHGAKVGELKAKLGEKGDKHRDDAKGTNSKGIVKRTKNLSEEEKDWFLRSYLSVNDQQTWDDPAADHGDRLALYDKAIALVDVELKEAGIGHGGKGSETREKLLKKLAYDFKKTNTLTRIKDYIKSDLPHTKNPRYRGPMLVSLIRKLRGDEFAHVRSKTEWMDDMKATVDAKHWALIQQLLGVSDAHDAQDGVTGTKEVDLLGATGTKGERKHTRDEARQIAADEAELKPSHWGAMLTAALKYCKYEPKRSEVNSIVTRAYMAAKRRERMTKSREVEVSGDSKLTAMTTADFMKEVKATISAGAMKIMETTKNRSLNGLKFGNALNALEKGECPTVEEQIDDLKFISPLKMTSGERINNGKVEDLFNDLDGKMLLEEWSNIQEFRDLSAAAKKKGGSKRAKAEAKERLRTFVIDIRADRHHDLAKMMSTDKLVKTQNKLRDRLIAAMETDIEVIQALKEAEFDNDELSRSKTKSLALADEQKMRSSGAQYNTLPVGTERLTYGNVYETSASTAPKESMGMLLGHTRKAESELTQNGGDRQQVVDDNIDNINLAQEELVRRGKNFDKIQKRFNMIMMRVAKVLVGVLVGAAMSAITVLTGGLGGLAAVGLGALMMAFKQTVLKSVKAALVGDRFNLTGAAWDVAFKVLVGAAVGVMGELAMPEVLASVGQGIDHAGNVLTETTTNHAPTDLNQLATGSALKFALGPGSKAVMMSAIREARATESNPAARQFMMMELGGMLIGGGFTIANEVYATVNEPLQRDGAPGTADDLGGKTLDKMAQTGGKAGARVLTTGARATRMAPKLRKLLQKRYLKKHKHGEDREGDLAQIVPQVLTAADDRIAELKQQISDIRAEERDGTERSTEEEKQLVDSKEALKDERAKLIKLRDDLKAEYDAWQIHDEQMRGGDPGDTTKATAMSVPVIMAALELDEAIG